MPYATESKITAARIREIYDYDSVTGVFRRKVYSKGRIDNIITSHDIEVDGEKHELSRFIWLHYYGEWPSIDLLVDHKDRKRSNNAIDNLRLASFRQNNTNKLCLNQYGLKGLEYRADRRSPWTVRIWHEGQRIYIGAFEYQEDVIEAYKNAQLEYHGEFACLE